MSKAVPTLSSEGWVTDPRAKLIKLLQYMIDNESDQSDYFVSFNIHSVIRKYVKKPGILASHLEGDLITYLETYFDEARVNVYYKVTGVQDEYALEIEVQVVTDGKTASIGRRLVVKEGQLVPDDTSDYV